MWWGNDARHKATLDVINQYQAKYPNVTIQGEYGGFDGYKQKLITQLSGGTAPDIMQVDQPWIYDLSAQGDMFVNLYKDKSIDLSAFDKEFLKSACTVNGQLLGLPSGINSIGLIYNADFFKQFNVPTDKAMDWDTLLQLGTAIHQKDSGKYLFNINTGDVELIFRNYIEQLTGNELIKSDGTLGFTQDQLNETLTFIKKLFDNGVIQPFTQSATFESDVTQNPKWAGGDLGAIFNWPSLVSGTQAAVKFHVGFTNSPVLKNAKSQVVQVRPSMLITINKASKNVTVASQFVNWMFNDTQAIDTISDQRGVPATTTGRTQLLNENKLNPDINKVVNSTLNKPSVVETQYSGNSEIVKILQDTIQQLAYNKTTPVAASGSLINQIKQKVTELKGAAN